MQAERGLDCRSILHYSEFPVENCILNTHTRALRQDFFTQELRQKVDYVEMSECAVASLKPLAEPIVVVQHSHKRPVILGQSNDEGIRRTQATSSPSSATPASPFLASAGFADQWSSWSACDPATSTKSRFRSCLTCEPKRESVPCFEGEQFNELLSNYLHEQEKTGLMAIMHEHRFSQSPGSALWN